MKSLKYLFLLLFLTGCNHFGLYTQQDVINLNDYFLRRMTVERFYTHCEVETKEKVKPIKVIHKIGEELDFYWTNIIPNRETKNVNDYIEEDLAHFKSVEDLDCRWDNLTWHYEDQELFRKKDVIRINRAIIKEQQAKCGDLICESSADLSRPEVVMRLLEQAMTWEWEYVGTEHYPKEYEQKEWRE